jgi:hypothetical protein
MIWDRCGEFALDAGKASSSGYEKLEESKLVSAGGN